MPKRRFATANAMAPAVGIRDAISLVRENTATVPRAASIIICTKRPRQRRRTNTALAKVVPANTLKKTQTYITRKITRPRQAVPMAKQSVLQMLQKEKPSGRGTTMANAAESAAQQAPVAKTTAPAESVYDVERYVTALARSIDAGTVELKRSPWVHPPSPMQFAEAEKMQRQQRGEQMLNASDVSHLVLRPPVFVWAPEYLFPEMPVACPTCRRQPSEKRWRIPKMLHGLSQLFWYITREYTCGNCKPSTTGKRGSRTTFSADTPAFMASLPAHANSLWQFCNTGRTLCDVAVVDFIRAMATRASWAAIADAINEVRQTSFARQVLLQYYQVCVQIGVNGTGCCLLM